MSLFFYRCDSCFFEFQVEQPIGSNSLRKCKQCGKFKLYRVIQNFTGVVPSTIGSLAEKNRRDNPIKMSEIDAKKKKEKPFYRSEDKPLNLSKIKNIQHYVETGEKN